MAVVASVCVAATTALVSIIALVAVGGTDAYENLVIVSVLTLLTTFTTAYGITRRTNVAVLLSSLCTVITVGAGFAVVYTLFSSLCGSNPSSC
jgi:hypothetical protein